MGGENISAGVHQLVQGDAQDAAAREYHSQADAPTLLHDEQRFSRHAAHGGQVRLAHTAAHASFTDHPSRLRPHQAQLRVARRWPLNSSVPHADNVHVIAMARKSRKRGATLPSQADRAPGKMDYVKLTDRTTGRSPIVEQRSIPDQLSGLDRPPVNRSESHMSVDPTAKELTSVRRQIHNRLGRLDRLRDLLATVEAGIAALEVRERQLVFQLWSDSPSRLTQLNRDHRKWRNRKDSK